MVERQRTRHHFTLLPAIATRLRRVFLGENFCIFQRHQTESTSAAPVVRVAGFIVDDVDCVFCHDLSGFVALAIHKGQFTNPGSPVLAKVALSLP